MTRRDSDGRPPRVRPRRAPSSTLVSELESQPRDARELAAARFALSIQHALAAALSQWGNDQAKLAEELGVSESAVSQTMRSDGNLRIATIGRYARAMGYQASLRLNPVVDGVPALDLPLPVNVATRVRRSSWMLVRAQSENVDGARAWTSQPIPCEAPSLRVVMDTHGALVEATTGPEGDPTTGIGNEARVASAS